MKILVALLWLAATAAMAADLTGTWSGSFKPEGGEHGVPQLITLKQQGQALTGSAGPNTGEQYPIENGKVDSSKASFQVTTGEWKFSYNLTLEKDELVGDLKLDSPTESRTAKVRLRRMKN
jgi:hypothetical protein